MADEPTLYEFEYIDGPQVRVEAIGVDDVQIGDKVIGPEELEFTAGFKKGSKAGKDAEPGLKSRASDKGKGDD